jgi:hypothetical protein
MDELVERSLVRSGLVLVDESANDLVGLHGDSSQSLVLTR